MGHTFTSPDPYGGTIKHYVPTDAGDVTDAIADAVLETADGWFPDQRIEWDDVWDRMEGQQMRDLPDEATHLSWGSEIDTPAMRKVQRYVNKTRRNS